MSNFEKIKVLLATSSLSKEDQAQFLVALGLAADERLADMAKLFEEDSSLIPVVYENYKAKFQAISHEDSAAWDKVVEDEQKQLEAIK